MTEIILNIPCNHTIICGWNSHAMAVLNELLATGRSVVVVARERPKELRNPSVTFVQGDSSEDEVLKRAGVESATSAIILAEGAGVLPADVVDARSILTALAVETLHPEIYSCLEILNPDNARHAQHANVDNIVYCDGIIANFIALCASQRGISGFANDIFSHADNRSSLNAIAPGPEWEGRTVGELFSFVRERGDLPLAVMRPKADAGRELWAHEINPAPTETVHLPLKVIYIRCEKGVADSK